MNRDGSIIYALVARNTTILAEYAGTSGNFQQVTRRLLEKIPASEEDSRMSYVYDQHQYHYLVSGGLTFLCLADESFGRRIPFAFLEDIRQRFTSTYGDRGRTAHAYMMNTDFSRILSTQMHHFSNDPNANKLSKVQAEIDSVKGIMIENVEKVLERGDKIDLLVDKAEDLNRQAFQFKKESKSLDRALLMKKIKITILLIVVCIILFYIIVACICGPLLNSCIHWMKKKNSVEEIGSCALPYVGKIVDRILQ